MSDQKPLDMDIPKELSEANEQLPIKLGDRIMPLDITLRSIALTLAQRHCGDKVVREGNLYQQLKMDNKLSGPLTTDHVIHTALIFEAYLWGKWSTGIADAMIEKTLEEAKQVLEKELKDEEPTRPHSGGENV